MKIRYKGKTFVGITEDSPIKGKVIDNMLILITKEGRGYQSHLYEIEEFVSKDTAESVYMAKLLLNGHNYKTAAEAMSVFEADIKFNGQWINTPRP